VPSNTPVEIANGEETCPQCKAPLEEVVITTFNKAHIENWKEYPLVVDAFK
jgi:hypothetical protein